MRYRLVVALILSSLIFSTGCAYVNITTPLDINLENTELGDKVGSASSYSVLWVVAWGDAGYARAAKNGNIKILNHADVKIEHWLFGIYTKRTVIVYGE